MGSIEDAIRDIVNEELAESKGLDKETIGKLVDELVDARFEHLTEKDMTLVDEHIKEALDDFEPTIDAEQVAEHIDCEEVAKHVDLDAVAGGFEAREIAEHIDVSEVARNISEEDVASHIDLEDVAGKAVEARLSDSKLREHIANFFESEWAVKCSGRSSCAASAKRSAHLRLQAQSRRHRWCQPGHRSDGDRGPAVNLAHTMLRSGSTPRRRGGTHDKASRLGRLRCHVRTVHPRMGTAT